MLRLVALIALIWGLISCQQDLFGSDPSADPTIPPAPTGRPVGPNPTIEIPPPI